MKAKFGTRYSPEGRTDLTQVIPLDTPLLVFVDPSSACNFKCPFCPCGGANQDNWSLEKKASIMPFELYKDVINQLCLFPQKIRTLRLYKEGEPLLNKRIVDMIRYAKEKNVAEKIDLTTNGYMLNHELSLALIDAGLDRINISIEALTSEGYRSNAGVEMDFDKFIENLAFLYENRQNCYIFIKISDFGLKGHTQEEFFEIFGDICDEISIEQITPVWPEFNLTHVKSEFEEGIYGNEVREVKVCPYIFYSMCINSNGTVSACLMDWNHKLIVGDAKDNSIVDIWNGEAMNHMRINHLKGNRSEMEVCGNCGQLTFGAMDNIDEASALLLEKIEKIQG